MRLAPTIRKDQILEAAIIVATKQGFNKLTRVTTAREAECSDSLIGAYYSTVKKLRNAVMKAAVQRRILPIIAYGLVTGNRQALKASDEVRSMAMGCINGGIGLERKVKIYETVETD